MKNYHFSFGIMVLAICLISLLIIGEVGAQEEPAEGEKVEEQEPVEKERQKREVKKESMILKCESPPSAGFLSRHYPTCTQLLNVR